MYGSDSPGALPETLRDLVLAQFAGRGDARITPRAAINQPYSIVIKADVNTREHKQTLYIKIAKDSKSKLLALMAQEYALLSFLAEAKLSNQINTPKPVLHSTEPAAIVTMEMPGTPLDRLLRPATRIFPIRRHAEAAETACRHLGQWLRAFHGSVPLELAALKTLSYSDYCENRFAELSERAPISLKRAEIDILKDFLASSDLAIADKDRRVCHGDFSSHNILYAEGSISVLDFTAFCASLPEDDIMAFVGRIEDLSHQVFGSVAAGEKLIAAFLEGYGYAGPRSNPRIWLATLRWTLSKVISIQRARARRPDVWYYNRRRAARYEATLKDIARLAAQNRPAW